MACREVEQYGGCPKLPHKLKFLNQTYWIFGTQDVNTGQTGQLIAGKLPQPCLQFLRILAGSRGLSAMTRELTC